MNINPARPAALTPEAPLDARVWFAYSSCMPVVEFAGNEWGAAVLLNAQSGGPLVDICDSAHAPVAFSCRSAHCGTCRVEVLEGRDLLDPAAPDELDLLQSLASLPIHRLACQAVVRPLPGRVRLKWVGAP